MRAADVHCAGSSKYQPQGSQLGPEQEDKVASMKPAKQTVTYDSSTGKMYEELGSSGAGAAAGRSSYFHNYQASYGGGAGAGAVYPGMGPPPAQYMSSYTSPGYVGPYDRSVQNFAFIWIVMTKV